MSNGIKTDDPYYGANYLVFGNYNTFFRILNKHENFTKDYTPLKLYDYSQSYLAGALMANQNIPEHRFLPKFGDALYNSVKHTNNVRVFFLNKRNIHNFAVVSKKFERKVHSEKIKDEYFYLKFVSPDTNIHYRVSSLIAQLILQKQNQQ